MVGSSERLEVTYSGIVFLYYASAVAWKKEPTQICLHRVVLTARKMHAGVVEMMLRSSRPDPNRVNNRSGRTPLSFAVGSRRNLVVELLMGLDDVSPNIPGRTVR